MNVENAYEYLAKSIFEFVAGVQWDVARSRTIILNRMTETSYWRSSGDEVVENDKFPSLEAEKAASKAAILLRDNILTTTGQRVWGLTFTLYPNGKFNIEYDYNKPEDYEETDEVIAGDEINQTLSDLDGNPPS